MIYKEIKWDRLIYALYGEQKRANLPWIRSQFETPTFKTLNKLRVCASHNIYNATSCRRQQNSIPSGESKSNRWSFRKDDDFWKPEIKFCYNQTHCGKNSHNGSCHNARLKLMKVKPDASNEYENEHSCGALNQQTNVVIKSFLVGKKINNGRFPQIVTCLSIKQTCHHCT